MISLVCGGFQFASLCWAGEWGARVGAGWLGCPQAADTPLDIRVCLRVGWAGRSSSGFGPGRLNLYLMQTGHFGLKISVSQDCCNKVPWVGWLKTRKFCFLIIQDARNLGQDVYRVGSFRGPEGEPAPGLILGFWCYWQPLLFLGLWLQSPIVPPSVHLCMSHPHVRVSEPL